MTRSTWATHTHKQRATHTRQVYACYTTHATQGVRETRAQPPPLLPNCYIQSNTPR